MSYWFQNKITKFQKCFLVIFVLVFFGILLIKLAWAQPLPDFDYVCCYNMHALPEKVCQTFDDDIGCQTPWRRVDANTKGRCETLGKNNNSQYKIYCPPYIEIPVIPQPTKEEKETPVVVPELQIQIPGFKGFTKEIEICLEEGKTLEECSKGQRGYAIPWLGEYIVAIYKWSIGAIAIIAIIMIMVGGFQWLMAAGNVGKISDAKSRITYAVIGLVIILTSNLILYSINPNLTIFQPLIIGKIERIEIESIEREEDIAPQSPSDFVNLTGDNIIGSIRVSQELVEPLRNVANRLKARGYQMIVASGYRTPQRQARLIVQHCQPCSEKFDPKKSDDYYYGIYKTCTGACSPSTCQMKNGPISCPHTTGRAVDVWGGKNGKICAFEGSSQECQKNLNACKNNDCQKALIEEMRKEGFCLLCVEAWHFEKPKMSSCCE